MVLEGRNEGLKDARTVPYVEPFGGMEIRDSSRLIMYR